MHSSAAPRVTVLDVTLAAMIYRPMHDASIAAIALES